MFEEEESKDSNKELLIQVGFEAFAKKYRPASSLKDSDQQVSSHDLCTMLSEFCMLPVKGPDIIMLLNDNGYTSEPIEKRLMWLLKTA
jgi:hypothetical protein